MRTNHELLSSCLNSCDLLITHTRCFWHCCIIIVVLCVSHTFLLITSVLLSLYWVCLIEIFGGISTSQHHVIKYWFYFLLWFLSKVKSCWISSFCLARFVYRFYNRALNFIISYNSPCVSWSCLSNRLLLLLSWGKLIDLLMFI